MNANAGFTPEWLRDLVARAEKELVEFKREWYDLDAKPEKAKLLKSMLALGNAVSNDKPGFLIVGVDDAKHGGGILGVPASPQPEKVAQVVAGLTSPPVRHNFHQITVGGLTVDVLEVMYSEARPHFAVRQMAELRCDVAYIRRGPTIGTMSGTELEAMYRVKLGLASTGQYQGQVYQMISENQPGWDFPRAHALI